MAKIRVYLNISAEQMQRYYRGEVQVVSATAEDGRQVEFPANVLRQFVGHEGVYGTFELHIDANNRLLKMSRIN